MIYKALTLLFLSFRLVFSQVFTEEEVVKGMIAAARHHNIPLESLVTIASTESDFRPLILTIETKPKTAKLLKRLAGAGLRIITGGQTSHSKLAIVNILPKSIEEAIFVARALKANGYTFDLGLMQINSCNFSLNEIDKLFYPSYNVAKSAKILKSCVISFKRRRDQIECYNRGAGNLKRYLKKKKRRKKFPYWKRFNKKRRELGL